MYKQYSDSGEKSGLGRIMNVLSVISLVLAIVFAGIMMIQMISGNKTAMSGNILYIPTIIALLVSVIADICGYIYQYKKTKERGSLFPILGCLFIGLFILLG